MSGKKISLRPVQIEVGKLNHHPQNPRMHDEANIRAIMQSYEAHGELAPLIVWGPKNYVIAGNGRLEAARRLGLKRLRCVRADHLTEQQVLSYMVADNKTTDMSRFDFGGVAEIMQKLDSSGYDLDATGFSEMEREPLFDQSIGDELKGFARPQPEDVNIGPTAKPKEDKNWLYIEYYGRDDECYRVTDALDALGLLKSDHEINPNEFLSFLERNTKRATHAKRCKKIRR